MDKKLIELIKQWREGTESYAEQVGYARGSDFAFRKCADDLEKALARIDAERGKSAAAVVEGVDGYTGFIKPLRKLNAGTNLFLSPTIPEGMAQDAERYRFIRMNRLWLKANLPLIAAPAFDEAIDANAAQKGGALC